MKTLSNLVIVYICRRIGKFYISKFDVICSVFMFYYV